MIHLVSTCMPPAFTIVTQIALDIARKVMALDFKLRKVPFILLRSLKRIIQFPSDTYRFCSSVKLLIRLVTAALKSNKEPLPLKRITGKEDDIVDNELDASNVKVDLGGDLASAAAESKEMAAEAKGVNEKSCANKMEGAAKDEVDDDEAPDEEEAQEQGDAADESSRPTGMAVACRPDPPPPRIFNSSSVLQRHPCPSPIASPGGLGRALRAVVARAQRRRHGQRGRQRPSV